MVTALIHSMVFYISARP